MKHPLLLVLAVIALLPIVGCRPAPRSATPAPPKWGTTRVGVNNHLAWPYRLDRVKIAVDGVVVLDQHGDRVEGARVAVGDLALDPGDHSVAADIAVSYASSPLGGSCAVELKWSQGVRVDWRPATVDLDVGLREVTYEFAERVKLAVKLEGASPLAHQSVPHQRFEVAVPDNAEAMLRAAEARLLEARGRGDVVQLACYDRKLEALRSLSHMYNERRVLWDEAREQDEREHHATVLRVVDRRMSVVWTEMNQCAGPHGQAVDALARVLVGGGCSEAAPVEPIEARRAP